MTDWWASWDFWVCFIAVVLFTAILISMARDCAGDFMLDIGFPAMFSSFGAAFVYFTVAVLANWWLPHNDVNQRYDLMILKDRSMVSGEVVLGSGQVRDEAGYSFYVDGGNWQQFLIVKGRKALVYQDLKAGQKPWIVLFNGCHIWGRVAPCFWSGTSVSEIHVPAGTIKPSLTLNGAAS